MVFGAEGGGLSASALAACDLRVSVPQQGMTQSFNVAACAALVVGEVVRRRSILRSSGDTSQDPPSGMGDAPRDPPSGIGDTSLNTSRDTPSGIGDAPRDPPGGGVRQVREVGGPTLADVAGQVSDGPGRGGGGYAHLWLSRAEQRALEDELLPGGWPPRLHNKAGVKRVRRDDRRARGLESGEGT